MEAYVDMDNKDNLERKIAILTKKLQQSEQNRRLIEQAKDHSDLVYRSSINKLDEQKKLLDAKNKELNLVRLELLTLNRILEEVATTDALTKIYNRRKLRDILNKEYNKAKANKLNFSVILMDIDWFKLVNDTYGHQVGDQVLFEISQLIKGTLKITEYIGRWGGEEFLIILPNESEQVAYKLAESLRLKISKYNFEDINQLTCSFGIAEFIEDDTLEQIIKKADDALYEAKKQRNKVCILPRR